MTTLVKVSVLYLRRVHHLPGLLQMENFCRSETHR